MGWWMVVDAVMRKLAHLIYGVINSGKPLDLKTAIEQEEKEKEEKELYQNKLTKLEQDMDEVKTMLRRNKEIENSKEN